MSERWQQVEQIYHAALERGAHERSAFLAEACAGDDSLRREVESLLAYEDQAENFIESPAREVAAKVMADEKVTTMLAGQTINHYKITAPLGAGGMGEVYLAEDTRLERKIALKFLPAHLTQDKRHLHRFQQEARAVAALSHPNVCAIHEVVETSEGRHCIVMEYVEGVTLREHIAERRMNISESLDVAIQVASALSAAHGSGIVHRDIKPENIMLRRDGYVKVLDFGLAKLTEKKPEPPDSENETRALELKTLPGLVMGTVAYMSPEQARGLPVDAPTDIWSLGVVLYEMVAGQKPFDGATPTDVIISIAEREPVPLASRAPDVPIQLERIVKKALAKDRDERYQTAEDLLIDLKGLRHELEIGAEVERYRQPSSGSEPAATMSNRQVITSRFFPLGLTRSRILILTALAGVLIIGGLVSALFFRQSSTPAPQTEIKSLAVLPLENLSGDPETEYLSDGITESLINRLSQLPNLKVIARSSAFRYKGRDVDARTAGRELGVSAVLTGRVIKRGDNLSVSIELVDIRDNSQLWGDQYNRQFSDILTVQREISQEVSERLRLRLTSEQRQQLAKSYTDKAEAYQLYLKGRYFWNKRTEEGMRKGIKYFRQAIDVDPGYSLAYTGLADSYNFLGAFGIAVLPPGDVMPKAKSAAMKALEIDDSLAEAHTSLAFVRLYYDWDWPGAEREFQRAIELNPNYAQAHQWYSHLLMARGRTGESISAAKRATEIDPLSLPANMNVGWQYQWARQYDLAVEHLRKLLEMDPNFEQGHWGLGLAYEQKGMFEEAAAEFQKAVALSGGNPVYVAALGHAYAVGGKKADALRVRDELMEQLELRYIPPYWVATLYVGLGEQEKALRWLEKAYAERSGGLIWLGVDPRMDSLRSELRFAALMQRVGLSQ